MSHGDRSLGQLSNYFVGLFFIFALTTGATLVFLINSHNADMEYRTAVRTAKTTAQNIDYFRSFYSTRVVQNVLDSNIDVTHQYHGNPSAIPLPATLSIELRDYMREQAAKIEYKIFSDYPFPWRTDRSLDVDELDVLKDRPSEELAFETSNGSVRHFSPVVMGETCVACHNSHPESPKTDWEVGDIRGYQAVSLPPNFGAHSHGGGVDSFNQVILFFVGAFGSAFFVILYLVRKNKAAFVRVEEYAESEAQKSIELSATNTRLEKSLSELNAILENAADGIVTINDHGHIISANKACEEIFGYKQSELIGENIKILMGKEHAQGHDTYIANFLNTGKGKIIGVGREVEAKRKNGEFFPVELSIGHIHHEDGTFFTGILRDVSERKRAEEELIHAREAAEASNTSKSRFLAMMSHEIRTPLNAIIGTVSLLNEESDEKKRGQFLSTARKAAENLQSIINDILDISKLEAEGLDFEPTISNPVDTINDVISVMEPRAQEKGINLEWSHSENMPALINTDVARLRQILINFVSNAIKFTDAGCVKITAGPSINIEPVGIRFEVIDTGVGINEKDLPQIFDEFWTKNLSANNTAPGTGLGLAISKRLADSLGGSIGVSSRYGEGATFWVELSVGNVDQSNKLETRNLDTVELAEKFTAHVLIAEDNSANQLVASAMLEKLGVTSDIVANGIEAIAAVERRSYSIILMDVNMPEMDGIEATKIIRHRDLAEDTPIVSMTANVMEGDEEKLKSEGFDDYLAKPFVGIDLRGVLARNLRIKRDP